MRILHVAAAITLLAAFRPAAAAPTHPQDVELVTHIHYPRGHQGEARPGGGPGGGSCPSRTFGMWPSLAVAFRANVAHPAVSDADAFLAGVTGAVRAWDDLSGLVTSVSSDDTVVNSTFVTSTMDGVNAITFEDLTGTSSQGAIAVTWTWRNRATKAIVEADMSMNTAYPWNTDGTPGFMDVQNIATHEAGHAFGLDHVSEPEHTMYTYGSAGEVKKRTLECGDIAGVRKLYGE